MCGIAGFWDQVAFNADTEVLRRMLGAINHRGPDDSGTWLDPSCGLALGHRRLSILDVSPLGHQPMSSSNNRFHVVFNGEIYNFIELRTELERSGATFRGHSDTEVLLAACERWGVHDATRRLAGMFAFAIWDSGTRSLYLVRDRMGEKPLYYGWAGGHLLFGSDLAALRQHPAWQGELNIDVLPLYFRHGYIPAPHSIYQGIEKLAPGSVVTFREGSLGSMPAPRVYWDPHEVALTGLAGAATAEGLVEGFSRVEALDALLQRVIAQEMLSDVPLGAFLSGGVDSSLIVALMQANSSQRVRTFTIGFHEPAFNEAHHARAVAEHLGTDHTELYITSDEAISAIPDMPRLFTEPFADVSQIPTYFVSRLARHSVTVSLSGDGGDELFGGYRRYLTGAKLWSRIRRVPAPLRAFLGGGARMLARELSHRTEERFGFHLGRYPRRLLPQTLSRLGQYLASEDVEGLYRQSVSIWSDPGALVPAAVELKSALDAGTRFPAGVAAVDRMMLLDQVSYLPDDILTKVDRTSMGVSLESRAPFLHHEVVAFAWGTPLSQKVRNDQGKWILRALLDKYVPRQLVDRPKMGFGVPIGEWLSGPLRDWADDLLDERTLRQQGLLAPHLVQNLWHQHRAGHHSWQYQLWTVLMFQAWLRDSAPWTTW